MSPKAGGWCLSVYVARFCTMFHNYNQCFQSCWSSLQRRVGPTFLRSCSFAPAFPYPSWVCWTDQHKAGNKEHGKFEPMRETPVKAASICAGESKSVQKDRKSEQEPLVPRDSQVNENKISRMTEYGQGPKLRVTKQSWAKVTVLTSSLYRFAWFLVACQRTAIDLEIRFHSSPHQR